MQIPALHKPEPRVSGLWHLSYKLDMMETGMWSMERSLSAPAWWVILCLLEFGIKDAACMADV